MLQPNEFKIYNASAGAGKTYTLVKEFLSLLLTTDQAYKFESILAITFTNKAANEMKQRIIERLREFSQDNYFENKILLSWAEELGISPEILHERSKKILTQILHNYSKFSVSTIDKFNLRLMKTFAQDLGLSINFNVEMDVETLLEKAVHQLFSKIGEDEALTQLLIEIALDNLQDGKSWDMTYDLIKNSKSLYSDTHLEKLKKLQQYDLQQFKSYRRIVNQKVSQHKNALKYITEEVSNLLRENQLSVEDFNYGKSGFINFFLKFSIDKFELPSERAQTWVENIDPQKYCSKKATTYAQDTIANLAPILKERYYQAIKTIKNLTLLRGVQKTISAISVLNEVEKAVENIKQDENVLLISEFNKLISSTIQKQPSGFIYERIGNKFHHYFIDEFQDTSILQWQNLWPLVENARASSDTVMLVGDAKQSIYRFRDGNPEQMMNLIDDADALNINVENLPKNWRSHQQIIEFNNFFYSSLVNSLPTDSYKELYKIGNQQLPNDKTGGYVQINFLEKIHHETESYKEANFNQILANIQNILAQGFSLNEIAILHRTGSDGREIAEFLALNNIPVISAESLLVKNSPEIQFLELFYKTISNEEDLISRSEFMLKLEELKLFEFDDLTKEIQELVQGNLYHFVNYFSKKNIQLNFIFHPSISLYDFTEKTIHAFGLGQNGNAHLQNFLDFILEYSIQNEYNLKEFLTYWDEKKDKESISLPNGIDAITLMTIHKSKGLEFPVVILPFVDWGGSIKDPKFWIPLKEEELPFDEFLMTSFTDLENISPEIDFILDKEKNEDLLDNLNMLYVATTRAIEQLYICTPIVKDDNKSVAKYFNIVFDNTQPKITFGEAVRISNKKENISTNQEINLVYNKWESKIQISKESSKRWKKRKSIVYGELVHELMQSIAKKSQIPQALQHAAKTGLINLTEVNSLEKLIDQIVSHPLLEKYFSQSYETISERDFIDDLGEIYRPDRLFIKDKKCTILDYKTGNPNDKHIAQIDKYAVNLEKLGYEIDQKLIVYISDQVEVKEVN